MLLLWFFFPLGKAALTMQLWNLMLIVIYCRRCCNQPADTLRFGFVTVLVLCSEIILEGRLILWAVFLEITPPPCSTNLSFFFPPVTEYLMCLKVIEYLVCLKVNVFPTQRAALRQ